MVPGALTFGGTPFVLASASPRRRELLTLLGIDFVAVAPDVEELREGDPAEVVVENAVRKARAGALGRTQRALVLGADTDVALDGTLLGKAPDPVGAAERLRALSGRTHEVFGGVALLREDELRTELVRTAVSFRKLDDAEIDDYLASGEWEGRAGAYAVQGLGASFVERVDGDLSNVIGLPVPTVRRMIENLHDHE